MKTRNEVIEGVLENLGVIDRVNRFRVGSMPAKLSKPKVLRRFIAGESAAEIAESIGYSRRGVLLILSHHVGLLVPASRYTAFGPLTEKRMAGILRGSQLTREQIAILVKRGHPASLWHGV